MYTRNITQAAQVTRNTYLYMNRYILIITANEKQRPWLRKGCREVLDEVKLRELCTHKIIPKNKRS